jgi:GT2 family glycosyltransferase
VKPSIFIATPHPGDLKSLYVDSLRRLCRELDAREIPYAIAPDQPVYGLVQKRNLLEGMFRATNFTHALWIDSDVGFQPSAVLDILPICGESLPFIFRAYPMPDYDWRELQRRLVEGEVDLRDPWNLRTAALNWPLSFKRNPGILPDGITRMTLCEASRNIDLVEVEWTGFGFNLIHRSLSDRMAREYARSCGTYTITPDHINCVRVFDHDETGSGEDVAYCLRARAIGTQLWVAPDTTLRHRGAEGNLAEWLPGWDGGKTARGAT